MEVFGALVLVGLSLLCWGGQLISWLVPDTAVRLTLMEAEDDVEPTYLADIRGESLWDSLTLWVMVAAGVLFIADISSWAYFGLVGGGMYLYFAGRGVVTRVVMLRRGLRIGAPKNVRVGFVFLGVWALMAVVTMIAASVSLEG